MKKVRFGLRLRVTLYILILISFIAVSTGIFFIENTRQSLINTMRESSIRETNSISFLSARSLLANDDIAIAENLQNMKGFSGFLYGRVVNNFTGTNTIPFNGMGDDFSKIEELINKEAEPLLKKETASKDPVVLVRKAPQYSKRDNLYIVQKTIFHPFVFEDPPVIAYAQIIISDRNIREEIAHRQQLLILVTLALLFLGSIASWLMAHYIVRPIKTLTKGAEEIGSGNLDYHVPEKRNDEIGLLAAQFNRMTNSLKEAQEQREEQLVLSEQIRQAQEIQEGMNPQRFLKRDTFQVKGFTRAAKGVGGDYFDFLFLPDGRLAVLISDVSGKSISASLVMVLIKTVVTTYLQLFHSMRGDIILSTINKVMSSQAHIDKFATILFFIYDPEKRTVEFSNGGHGPIIVYRAAAKELTASKHEGLPMGIDEDNEYKISRLTLEPGDIILLYTDGITEAWNTEKEEFSLHRLREKIIEYADLNAKEIIDRLVVDIDNFAEGAEQHDDMTLVVLKAL